MNENNTINLNTERKPGGLYRNIKMSVKTVVNYYLLARYFLISIAQATRMITPLIM